VAAGLAGTAAMSAAMLAAKRAGLLDRLPPHEMTARSMRRAGVADDVDPETRHDLGWVAHFAFGAGLGAAFALGLATWSPDRRDLALPAALPYALAVWAISYVGWIPALRLLPPPTRDDPDRPVAMVAAHLVFGTVLGEVLDRTEA
jgi:hypothetical protein